MQIPLQVLAKLTALFHPSWSTILQILTMPSTSPVDRMTCQHSSRKSEREYSSDQNEVEVVEELRPNLIHVPNPLAEVVYSL
jgi:hypothetical protein